MKGKKEQIDNGAKRYRSLKETMQFLKYYVTKHQITDEDKKAYREAPIDADLLKKLPRKGQQVAEEDEALKESKRERRHEVDFNSIKRTLYKGIEGKRDEPDSELFRLSKDLLDRVDRFQSAPSSVTQYEMRKFEADLSVYFSLWRGEADKRSESAPAEKPAKREKSTPLGKLEWMRAWLWKLYDATVKSALEWLWTKIFSS